MSTRAAASPVPGSDPEPMMDLNMTPLIDVMLVLIIMLIITIPRQQNTLNLPLSQPGISTTEPDVVKLDIDFDGTITVDGVLMASRAELSARLGAIASSAKPQELHVRANKLAEYKVVVGAMSLAQRAGVKGIGLVGNEQM